MRDRPARNVLFFYRINIVGMMMGAEAIGKSCSLNVLRLRVCCSINVYARAPNSRLVLHSRHLAVYTHNQSQL